MNRAKPLRRIVVCTINTTRDILAIPSDFISRWLLRVNVEQPRSTLASVEREKSTLPKIFYPWVFTIISISSGDYYNVATRIKNSYRQAFYIGIHSYLMEL